MLPYMNPPIVGYFSKHACASLGLHEATPWPWNIPQQAWQISNLDYTPRLSPNTTSFLESSPVTLYGSGTSLSISFWSLLCRFITCYSRNKLFGTRHLLPPITRVDAPQRGGPSYCPDHPARPCPQEVLALYGNGHTARAAGDLPPAICLPADH